MEIEFLGTGTSTGIPQIGCSCRVCRSHDDKDKRLRTSVIIRTKGKNILIDCGPDFREQILRASSQDLDMLLLTHSHYDHVGGIDDLRPYCAGEPFPVYCRQDVIRDLKSRIPYCFSDHPYPGVPSFKLTRIDEHPFEAQGIEIRPINVMHFKLPILGYQIENMAYITDAKYIDDSVVERLKGIDLLIINALRKEPHISHMSLDETLEIVGRIFPGKTYLIHMSHDMGLQEEVSLQLPRNVFFAYDKLKLIL